MKCIQCDSSKLLEDVGVIDRSGLNLPERLSLVTQKNPQSSLRKGSIYAPVYASVCETCGYVMLHAKPQDIEALKEGQPPKFIADQQ